MRTLYHGNRLTTCGILPSRLFGREKISSIHMDSPLPPYLLLSREKKNEKGSPLRQLSFPQERSDDHFVSILWSITFLVSIIQRMMTAASCPKPDSLGLVYSWLLSSFWHTKKHRKRRTSSSHGTVSALLLLLETLFLENKNDDPTTPYSRPWVGSFTPFPSFKS